MKNNTINKSLLTLSYILFGFVIVCIISLMVLFARLGDSKPISITCDTPGLTYEEALKYPQLDRDGKNGPCEEQFGIFGSKVKKKT